MEISLAGSPLALVIKPYAVNLDYLGEGAALHPTSLIILLILPPPPRVLSHCALSPGSSTPGPDCSRLVLEAPRRASDN